jgi:hypothetical protein
LPDRGPGVCIAYWHWEDSTSQLSAAVHGAKPFVEATNSTALGVKGLCIALCLGTPSKGTNPVSSDLESWCSYKGKTLSQRHGKLHVVGNESETQWGVEVASHLELSSREASSESNRSGETRSNK